MHKPVTLGLAFLSFAAAPATPQEIVYLDIPESDPEIIYDSNTQTHSMYLNVLTYNIKGLPWPIADRQEELSAIAQALSKWQMSGNAPDVVVLQEAFTTQSQQIGAIAGYQNTAYGPGADAEGKLLNSGLVVYSKYPIATKAAIGFSDDACAGYDCFANKGILFVTISVPGLPVPISVATTHLNSRSSAGVSYQESYEAYQLQVSELADFIATERPTTSPLLFAGDVNVRRSTARQTYFASHFPYQLTRRYCSDGNGCRRGEEDIWSFQDHQAFSETEEIQITPVQSRELFNRPGEQYSDHNANLVVYKLTW